MTSKRHVDDEELLSIPMFSSLGPEQLEEVRSSTRVVKIEAREPLFRVGEPSKHFYFVRHGQIKLFRGAADGGEKIVTVVTEGQTFAETVMFIGENTGYPLSAQAIAPSELIAFNCDAIREFLRGSTDICFQVMGSMSRRVRALLLHIDDLTLHNATYRLVNYLLRRVPEDASESSNVQLMMSKVIVASRLSIQPETFSRILQKLRSDGLIEVGGSRSRPFIVLQDVEGLRKLIAE